MKHRFLPYNYARTIYQRLQNLHQGNLTVGEYATEFFILLTQNEINENDEQSVSQFIGGLQPQFQNSLNLFDLITVSEAHQRALLIERQNWTDFVPWKQPTGPIRGSATAPATNNIN